MRWEQSSGLSSLVDVAGEFVDIDLCNQKQFFQLKRGAKAPAESEGKKVSEVGEGKVWNNHQGEKKVKASGTVAGLPGSIMGSLLVRDHAFQWLFKINLEVSQDRISSDDCLWEMWN